MKKLQVAAAAASLFAVAGVATAAQVNSSGARIAAETIFKTGVVGQNTKVKAPEWTYLYEGGVSSQSRQKFQITANLTGGAHWATDTARQAQDDLLKIFPTGAAGAIQAHTIKAIATINGERKRLAVLPLGATVAQGKFAIILERVERGDQIGGSPLKAGATNDSAVTYFFEVVNNLGSGSLTLQQLSLSFSAQKANQLDATEAPSYFAASETDSFTSSITQFPTVYNLQSQTSDTTTQCTDGGDGVNLQAVSGNNDPAVLSEEETQNNSGVLRGVGNYIIVRRATQMALLKDGDRLIQTTNSFQTNLLTSPVNGIGGTGGGRYSFKPSRTYVANVYGGNGTGSVSVNNDLNTSPNTTILTGVGAGTSPERATSKDELAAKLATLTFTNAPGTPLDRLLDLDAYGFKREGVQGLPTPNSQNGVKPSDRTSAFNATLTQETRTVGDFSTVANGDGLSAPFVNANIYGGVDINSLVITFTTPGRPNGSWAAPGSTLTIVRGNSCVDAGGAKIAGVGGLLVTDSTNAERQIWTFDKTALGLMAGAGNSLADSPYSICYGVSGETTIPSATFTNVTVTMSKDDPTEQSIIACTPSMARVYGGVKIDVRNLQTQQIIPNPTAGDARWIGVLRIINNSETDPARVEGQYIHLDGRYGKWGTLVERLAPRAATYIQVTPADLGAKLTNDVDTTGQSAEQIAALVNNGPVLTPTMRLRVSADVSTLRVQNYVFNTTTESLAEFSSSQGADFVNIDSSNRDHIDQDAQFDIVKDMGTLVQRVQTVDKARISGTTSGNATFTPAP